MRPEQSASSRSATRRSRPAAALAPAIALAITLSAFVSPAFAEQGHRAARRTQDSVTSRRFQRTLPLRAGGVFSLANVNGSITVEGWAREEVQISGVETTPARGIELSAVKIDVLARPGAVAVRTVYPEGEGVDVSVEYHVRVPRRVRLAGVATVNGSVRVRAVEGGGELRTVNGNVEMYDGAGRFDARSTNGNIYMELRSLGEEEPGSAAPVTMETVNGSVVLSLPAQIDSDMEIRTWNGDFSSELPLELRASSSGRELRCRLGAGGSPLRIRTMNGAVRLLMARPIV
jgi:hypothetical protein